MIQNLQNLNKYIGSAIDTGARWSNHKYMLRNKKHPNRHLQGAWDIYGEGSFSFSVLECAENEVLTVREQFWMDALKPEYNLAPNAQSQLGFRHSEESKKKMSEASRARGARPPSRAGISPTQQSIEKQRLKLVGKKRPPEVGAKISASKKGYKFTEEARAKMSLAKLGNQNRRKKDAKL